MYSLVVIRCHHPSIPWTCLSFSWFCRATTESVSPVATASGFWTPEGASDESSVLTGGASGVLMTLSSFLRAFSSLYLPEKDRVLPCHTFCFEVKNFRELTLNCPGRWLCPWEEEHWRRPQISAATRTLKPGKDVWGCHVKPSEIEWFGV